MTIKWFKNHHKGTIQQDDIGDERKIIVNTQTAYVKGRSGIDNLRSIQFFTDHCKEQQVESVLVSLDAKKAFDSVDHGYICGSPLLCLGIESSLRLY